MRRLALIGLFLGGALVLVPTLAVHADDGAPATPPAAPAARANALRVSVDLSSTVDGEAEASNTFQYYVFERLSAFGIRCDSLKPIGQERLDTWINGKVAKWDQREPGAPPASLTISGSAGCGYKNAEFFGQAQAHNFDGRVDVSLKDAAGTVLATVGFAHSWGRLPQKYTRSQVQQEYNDMVFTGVVLALLHQPAVWNGVPEAKRAELRTWIDQQKTRLLTPLEANMRECELARLIRGLALPADEAPR
jgi:hypothetical protein